MRIVPLSIRKVMRDIHTADARSSTYDWLRVTLSVMTFTGLGLLVFSVGWRGHEFDFEKFGLGCGLLIAAGGGAMWARKDVEVSPRVEKDKKVL